MLWQRNILDYLKSTAAPFPDKPAFTDEVSGLSFSELDSQGRALGTYIASQTECTNRPIVVLVERTAATIAAFMGVLYSGNYYVPVDAQMPVERVRGIISQLKPLFVLHSEGTRTLAESCQVATQIIDVAKGFIHVPDEELLNIRIGRVLDIDPVYCLFTSGSTGTPKGIVVSHRSLIDFTEWMSETFKFDHMDIMANQAPFYFDTSMRDVYPALKCGATVHIIPKKLFMLPIKLMEFIAQKEATVLNWATAAFHLVANSGVLSKVAPECLKQILLGGEALYAKQLNIWRAALPNVSYVNVYGPTEATVDSTYYIIDRHYDDHEVIPIGIQCANKEVMLLDDNLFPVPSGEAGEICVRGIGLARGYFGDDSKTTAAFVQNPANPWFPDTLYRTGDIGRVNENGLITFLSRKDGQIKHMGYRIELGEIETTLSALPQIRELACIFDEKRDKIILFYAGDIGTDSIIVGIKDILPKYMYPNIFRQMEHLPRNPNGKVDRVKLRDYYECETKSEG